MFRVQDIRQTRLFQEAMAEGRVEGWREGREEMFAVAMSSMAAKKMSAEEIAAILNLDVDRVRQELAKATRN